MDEREIKELLEALSMQLLWQQDLIEKIALSLGIRIDNKPPKVKKGK